MDETYVKVGGLWKYLYRAVDKDGDTTDFLLCAKRDHAAARAFFERAIDLHDLPEKITIDKSSSNTAAIVSFLTPWLSDRDWPRGFVRLRRTIATEPKYLLRRLRLRAAAWRAGLEGSA
jgi:transposase-like protein